jgi:hypothetical protein
MKPDRVNLIRQSHRVVALEEDSCCHQIGSVRDVWSSQKSPSEVILIRRSHPVAALDEDSCRYQTGAHGVVNLPVDPTGESSRRRLWFATVTELGNCL